MMGKIEGFGVIGSGVMGRGIVELAASRGDFQTVVMCDVDPAQLDSAMKGIEKSLTNLEKKGKLEEGKKSRIFARIKPANRLEDLSRCDFIAEAITEKMEIKKELYSKLSKLIGNHTFIGSNTSSIPITLLASQVKNPENVIGMHFMNPVPVMKGLEIIKGLYTSVETFKLTLELGKKFGKEISISKDKAGFVVNRILMPMLNDAINGVNTGISDVSFVDRYFTEQGNGPSHRMGPFELSDLIGLDTTCNILKVLAEELGPAYAPDPLLVKMVEKGALGAKNGKGFYKWESWKKQAVNPLVAELQETRCAGPSAENGTLIGKRSWLRIMNEAVRVVEEGTSSVPDLDRSCVFCLNHPVGILHAVDRQGIIWLSQELHEMEVRFGSVYKAATLLKRMVDAGIQGKEKGNGFFQWNMQTGTAQEVSPIVERYLSWK